MKNETLKNHTRNHLNITYRLKVGSKNQKNLRYVLFEWPQNKKKMNKANQKHLKELKGFSISHLVQQFLR